MSELVEPVITLEFYERSSRARQLPAEASEFSAFLKRYITRWAGEAGAGDRRLLESGHASVVLAPTVKLYGLTIVSRSSVCETVRPEFVGPPEFRRD